MIEEERARQVAHGDYIAQAEQGSIAAAGENITVYAGALVRIPPL